MTILSKPHRRQLETTIKQAREIAEDAAKEAIARMAVAEAEPPAHLSDDNRALRRRLRAHARALGDAHAAAGEMSLSRLQDATSYEIWHRMLFGRFLAENGLLVHPELGAAMSVAELRDLAKEEGAADEWALAERYAAPGLPGVFKPDDPVLALSIAPEFSKRLRTLLSGLPEEVFIADDSLGWTYQFWRASEKEAVNAAGGKIGATELPAVTQLFTESYMVKFLLHNTLGAWWAGKVLALDPRLARDALDEDALREACSLPGITWEFLRFIRNDDGDASWRPAAGTFPGWPTRAAEISYCDPCCGSGHFLVEAFGILAALRQQEEKLSAGAAAVAVLRDNLHGLEIDGRCVQIAAFNVALAAWKLAGAPINLPTPHIAWVGAPPPMSRAEMAALAEEDASLRRALETLYDQFAQAPLLGSLLEVGARDLLDADLRERSDAALAKLRGAEAEQSEGAIAARGLLDAAALLGRSYVLQATNVPYLGRVKQKEDLGRFVDTNYASSKTDLSTVFIDRMWKISERGGTSATISPQNWLFLGSYKNFRKHLLEARTINFIAALGEEAWEAFGMRGPKATLCIISNAHPANSSSHGIIDTTAIPDLLKKKVAIGQVVPVLAEQSSQRLNPDCRITFLPSVQGELLEKYAAGFKGITAGDNPRIARFFWESTGNSHASFWQSGFSETNHFLGRELVIHRGQDFKELLSAGQAYDRGLDALGQQGVCIQLTRMLFASLFSGDYFDTNVGVILPRDPKHLGPIWAFCSSPEYVASVRRVDQSLKVTNATLVKVPFDLARWQAVFSEQYPHGLPEPYSDDPTQWLFHGHPAFAEEGTQLHVALARIAGYRWPSEADMTMRLSTLAKQRIALASALPGAGDVGLLPLHSHGAGLPLADRLRDMLADAFGGPLSPGREQALVRAADTKLDNKEARNATLETWLRDRAFRQHCVLFHQRPFLWQIWDGIRDGFSVFLNYRRLDRAALDKLTYTLLGDWIRTARAEGNTARLERAEQLQQKLALIIQGESPYDIFVRWKPLSEQPFGWEPDFDDGVRLNIRPFITAGILRERPKGISWTKDRGSDAPSSPWYDLGSRYGGQPGDRVNDHHTTLAEKRAARGTS